MIAPADPRHVTDHFEWAEFACPSGEPMPDTVRALVLRLCRDVLEPLRERFGGPLVVVSGWRSPAYNKALRQLSDERARAQGRPRGGVAVHSRHVVGDAVDVRPLRPSGVPFLAAAVEELLSGHKLETLGGFGRYPHWLHLDLRPTSTPGRPVRWIGDGFGSET